MKDINVLIIGYDGRAFSLAKRLLSSPHCLQVYCCPGSPTINHLLHVPCFPVSIESSDQILQLCCDQAINLVIVTTIETSLAGVVDVLQAHEISVFGPTRAACQLEASKHYGKQISQRYGLPLPEWYALNSLDEARATVIERNQPFVIKKDGLAGGLGVTVCTQVSETLHVIGRMAHDPPDLMVLEEYLVGMEVCFTWAVNFASKQPIIVPLVSTFEHKRAYTGNLGPLTAEMGSLSLAGIPELAHNQLLLPLGEFLSRVGYIGILDINCMYDHVKQSLLVLEYTCRFGDPGTEIMLPMISNDWVEIFMNVVQGRPSLPAYQYPYGLGVVLASGGYPYPNACLQGVPIESRAWPDLRWFDVMSATRRVSGGGWQDMVTQGGRQILILGAGQSVLDAQSSAYSRCREWFSFQDMFYRLDIGDVWFGLNATQRALVQP